MKCESIDNMAAKTKVGILLATYCEAPNIELLIEQIENLNLDAKILVVDDSSPDGTAQIVRTIQERHSNVKLVVRPQKMGLGTALTDGFKVFLSSKDPPTQIVVMDADFSHNPRDVKTLLTSMSGNVGLVIGSRYCKGGTIQGWSVTRRLISRTANVLANVVGGLKLHDCTSGFRCYSTQFLKTSIENLHCTTYEIQIETARQARLQQFDIRETPVVFINRKRGKSKLSGREIQGFLSYIFKTLRKD